MMLLPGDEVLCYNGAEFKDDITTPDRTASYPPACPLSCIAIVSTAEFQRAQTISASWGKRGMAHS